jgi:hypothetical protein
MYSSENTKPILDCDLLFATDINNVMRFHAMGERMGFEISIYKYMIVNRVEHFNSEHNFLSDQSLPRYDFNMKDESIIKNTIVPEFLIANYSTHADQLQRALKHPMSRHIPTLQVLGPNRFQIRMDIFEHLKDQDLTDILNLR